MILDVGWESVADRIARWINREIASAAAVPVEKRYQWRYHIGMIVVDANIILSGLRSIRGPSHVVLRGMLSGEIPFAASPAVVLEYEDLLKRPGILGDEPWVTTEEIDEILDVICARAIPVSPWFRFRPFLADPKDDLYIECALAINARIIVTKDRHFYVDAVTAFGLKAMRAGEFVAEMSLSRRYI